MMPLAFLALWMTMVSGAQRTWPSWAPEQLLGKQVTISDRTKNYGANGLAVSYDWDTAELSVHVCGQDDTVFTYHEMSQNLTIVRSSEEKTMLDDFRPGDFILATIDHTNGILWIVAKLEGRPLWSQNPDF